MTDVVKSPVKRTAEQIEMKKKKKIAYKKEIFKSGSFEELHHKNGLLVSIGQGREKGAGRELFNLIIDAADRLKLEYDELNFPFKIVDLGIRCLLFVDLGDWDPIAIVDDMFTNVCGTQQQLIKFTSRIIPCHVIPANMDAIIEESYKLLQQQQQQHTFAVEFKSRYCEKFRQRHKHLIHIADSLLIKCNGGEEIKRKAYDEKLLLKKQQRKANEKKPTAKKIVVKEDVVVEKEKEVDENEMVTIPKLDGPLKVNLGNPHIMINVEVFKTVASVSALKNYRKYRKYNLNLVANEGFLE